MHVSQCGCVGVVSAINSPPPARTPAPRREKQGLHYCRPSTPGQARGFAAQGPGRAVAVAVAILGRRDAKSGGTCSAPRCSCGVTSAPSPLLSSPLLLAWLLQQRVLDVPLRWAARPGVLVLVFALASWHPGVRTSRKLALPHVSLLIW